MRYRDDYTDHSDTGRTEGEDGDMRDRDDMRYGEDMRGRADMGRGAEGAGRVEDFPRRRRPDEFERGRGSEGGRFGNGDAFEGRGHGPVRAGRCGRGGDFGPGRGEGRGHEGGCHRRGGDFGPGRGEGRGPEGGCHGRDEERGPEYRGSCHGRPEGFGPENEGGWRGRRELPPLPQDDSLSSLIHRCFRQLRHGGSAETQKKILVILTQTGETPQRALQELLGVRPGSMSEVLGKLESKGFIERTRSGMDRRSAMLRITDEGRAAASQEPEEKDLFSALSAEEQETLRSLLKKALGENAE